jgi:hypothetical protein
MAGTVPRFDGRQEEPDASQEGRYTCEETSGNRLSPLRPRRLHDASHGTQTEQQRSPSSRRQSLARCALASAAQHRDAEMVRQVPLQWPSAILRLRPVDCSSTPSYSMKWQSHADHGQKHETGDLIHPELDDQRPITEAAEPKMQSSRAKTSDSWLAVHGRCFRSK